MGKWSNLTAKQKAAIIRFAIDNGVSDIKTIRDTYDIYAKDSLANKDYDMGAARAAGFKPDSRKHYPDAFKKPNHPTFSTESIYHSENTPGGAWEKLNGNWTYTPSEYVLQQHGWNGFLEGFRNQEGSAAYNTSYPIYEGGVMLPEVDVYPTTYKDGGKIHIAPSKKGTFTAAATKHGKSVQAFASQVLAHPENYSPAMRKKANFARNAAHWHEDGGLTNAIKSGIQAFSSQTLANKNNENYNLYGMTKKANVDTNGRYPITSDGTVLGGQWNEVVVRPTSSNVPNFMPRFTYTIPTFGNDATRVVAPKTVTTTRMSKEDYLRRQSAQNIINQGVVRDATKQKLKEQGINVGGKESNEALAIQRQLDIQGEVRKAQETAKAAEALIGMSMPSTYINLARSMRGKEDLGPEASTAIDVGSAILATAGPIVAKNIGKRFVNKTATSPLLNVDDFGDIIVDENKINGPVDDEIIQRLRYLQYNNYLATGVDTNEGLVTAIPKNLQTTDFTVFPEYVTKNFETSVFPRMVAERPWLNSEKFLATVRKRANGKYSTVPELTTKFASEDGKGFGGIYYPSTNKIIVQEKRVADALPHEIRHRIDKGMVTSMTPNEYDLLNAAYGDDFLSIGDKFNTVMKDEMITTNLDSRGILLGKRVETSPVAVQNILIDRAPDEEIINAVKHANAYGKHFIEKLEKEGKLTPERIKAFRESMKRVGGATIPVSIGAGSVINQKSTGGPLYPFSFLKHPLPAVRYAGGGKL